MPRCHRQNRTTQRAELPASGGVRVAVIQSATQHTDPNIYQPYEGLPRPKVPPFLHITIMTSSSAPATAVTSPAHQTAHHPQPAVSIANFPPAQPAPRNSHNCMFLPTQPATYLDIFQEVPPSIFYNLPCFPILATYPAHHNLLHFARPITPTDAYTSHSSSLWNINPSYIASPS